MATTNESPRSSPHAELDLQQKERERERKRRILFFLGESFERVREHVSFEFRGIGFLGVRTRFRSFLQPLVDGVMDVRFVPFGQGEKLLLGQVRVLVQPFFVVAFDLFFGVGVIVEELVFAMSKFGGEEGAGLEVVADGLVVLRLSFHPRVELGEGLGARQLLQRLDVVLGERTRFLPEASPSFRLELFRRERVDGGSARPAARRDPSPRRNKESIRPDPTTTDSRSSTTSPPTPTTFFPKVWDPSLFSSLLQ